MRFSPTQNNGSLKAAVAAKRICLCGIMSGNYLSALPLGAAGVAGAA